MALLTPLAVARRLASIAGIIVLLALALTLLWRVYLHHQQADPYTRDEPVTVQYDGFSAGSVKIANELS
jgi:hypothetical protein